MDGHPQSCGRCGGQVRIRSVRGVQAYACRSCGLVMMQPRALERLLGAPVDLGPVGPAPDAPASTGRRGGSIVLKLLLVTLGGLLGALLVAIPVVALLLRPQPQPLPEGPSLDAALTSSRGAVRVEPRVPPPVEEPGEALDAQAEPELPPEESEPEEPEATEVDNARVPEEEPPDEPVPAPGPSRFQTLLQRGWNEVNVSPSAAAESFRRALDLRPGDLEASYGYGYALLRQGDPTRARPFLCQAHRGGNIEVTRDVQALLAQNGLSCSR